MRQLVRNRGITHVLRRLATLGAFTVLVVAPLEAAAALSNEAASCQSALAKGLAKFEKAKIKAWSKCLDGILKGKGCDATKRDAAVAAAIGKAKGAIAGGCTDALLFMAQPNGVGFAQSCQLEAGTLEPYEQACAALLVTNKDQLADCLVCWKEGEIYEWLKILYPCLQGQVPAGSDLDCGTAPGTCPSDADQIACLTAISKAGTKWLLTKVKRLEKCLNGVRSGKIPGPCPDAVAAPKLTAAAQKARDAIAGKCPSLPPWWDVCPEDSSAPCDLAIASVGNLGDCVVGAGEEIVDELLCWQYPGAAADGIPCPTELETTTTTSTSSSSTTSSTSSTSTSTSTSSSTTTSTSSTTTTTTPHCGTFFGAPLNGPEGIAVDASGFVYVADGQNNRIRKFTDTGTFVTTWGTSGTGDGQFNYPVGIAVDGSGNVYVADDHNNRIQKFTDTGAFVTKWGTSGSGDGQLTGPAGLAVQAGNVYVPEEGSNNRVQVFTDTGGFVTKWGTGGSGDGQFNRPHSVAVDAGGDIYVVDANNARIQKFTGTGMFLVKWGSFGSGNGQFNDPSFVTIDGSGTVFVSEYGGQRIQSFDSTGTFQSAWNIGTFWHPSGVAFDGSGNLYVSDIGNNVIRKFTCP